MPRLNLAVIVFTRCLISDTDILAICRVDFTLAGPWPGRYFRYRSYDSVLTREKIYSYICKISQLSRSSRFKSHKKNRADPFDFRVAYLPIEFSPPYEAAEESCRYLQGHQRRTDTLKG